MSESLRRYATTRLPARADIPHTSTTAIGVTETARDLRRPDNMYGLWHEKASDWRATAGTLQQGTTGQRRAPKEAMLPTTRATITTATASLQQPSGRRFGFGGSTGTKTPSLVSGSSAPSFETPVPSLRRTNPASINKHPSGARTESVTTRDGRRLSSKPAVPPRPHDDSVLGILPPSASTSTSTHRQPVVTGARHEPVHSQIKGRNIRGVTSGYIPPQPRTPIASVESSSTRYSGSASPFSHVSTPTSMSSHSPGLTVSSYGGFRRMQETRPDLFSSKLDRISVPTLRKSGTSSSSGSTIKASEYGTSYEARQRRSSGVSPPLLPTGETAGSESAHGIDERLTSRRIDADAPSVPIPTQVPPELAHLLHVDRYQPVTVSFAPHASSRPLPPKRPSRDGAPNLAFAREPSPVIQSGLPKLQTSFHKRNISSETTGTSATSTTSSTKSRFGMPSRSVAPKLIPNPGTGAALPPAYARPTLPIPATSTRAGRPLDKAVAPSPAGGDKPASRFGFLSKRNNLAGRLEKTLKRKGPMAGTGHEGYGIHSIRGRSGSTTSASGSMARSRSAGSTTGSNGGSSSSPKSSFSGEGDMVMDAFISDRLTPTVLRGQGSFFSTDNTSDSTSAKTFAGFVHQRPSVERGLDHSQATHLRRPSKGSAGRLPSLVLKSIQDPSVTPGNVAATLPTSAKGPSSSRTEAGVSTLRANRSSQQSQVANHAGATAGAKAPLAVSSGVHPPSSDSDDREQTSSRRARNSLLNVAGSTKGAEGSWLKSKVIQQPKLFRKWNFYQRAQRSPQKDSDIAEVTVTISPRAPPRSIAHYALSESPDQVDFDDLEQIMREAQTVKTDETGSRPITPPLQRGDHRQSTQYLSPTISLGDFTSPHCSKSPQAVLNQDSPILNEKTNVEALPQSRPSRLVQVGRIPRIVSVRERDQDRKLADRSFSRPFAVSQPRPAAQLPHPAAVVTQHNLRSSPPEIVTEETAPVLQQIAATKILAARRSSQQSQAVSGRSATAEPQAALIVPGARGKEQLQAANDLSVIGGLQAALTVSSAEDNVQVSSLPPLPDRNSLAPSVVREFLAFPSRQNSELSYTSSSGVVSFAGVSRNTSDAAAPSTEEEIWDEYDDLIDDVLSPRGAKTPLSTGSSLGAPFHYAMHASNENHDRSTEAEATRDPTDAGTDGGLPSVVATFLRPATPDLDVSSAEHESASLSAPHSAPMSITDFYTGYGERNISGRGSLAGGPSNSSSSRASTASVRYSRPSTAPAGNVSARLKSSFDPEVEGSAKTQLGESKLAGVAEGQDERPQPATNLRFAALMTAKWLSFGRLLFSPAQLELGRPSYAGQNRVLVLDGLGKDWSYYCALTYPDAQIYNLSPDPTSSPNDPQAWPPTLANNHILPHQSLAVAFPFPRGFFAAVVLRFPIMTEESHYRHAISECKRVLRPGGYLELSILDIDLVKMGNKARKAVRELKTKIQGRNPEMCLKNGSDVFMRLLGRRGFEGLQRCFVGVKVAGGIPTGSIIATAEQHRQSVFRKSSDSATAPAGPGDEGIAQMVCSVGRWWYSRCYETGTLANGDLNRSIFAEPSFLDECEERGTSFRLMFAHAQKPLVSKRRTASV